MADVQVGESGPRPRARPHADPGRRRRRDRTTLIRSRIVGPFDCLNPDCQAPLAVVMADHEHNTYLMVGPMAMLTHGTIRCECGAEREFISVNVPPKLAPPFRPGVDTLPKSA
jgi:hypothetical protein